MKHNSLNPEESMFRMDSGSETLASPYYSRNTKVIISQSSTEHDSLEKSCMLYEKGGSKIT